MRKLPPLASLRAFEAAARHMSFRAAAEELGVTPTAISHQVAALEAACGGPLFRRRPRPLALTGMGERLYPRMREAFDAMAGALEGAREERERRRPLLRVTTTTAFASRWLVPRLSAWRRAQPGLALEVIGTDQVLDLNPGGDADLAIRYARRPPAGGLAAHELFRDRFWPVCTPALLAASPIRRPADVARHVLIHFAWPASDPLAPTWRHWFDMARRQDPLAPEAGDKGELNFDQELHGIEAVIAGEGIGICSDVLVGRELASGALVRACDLALPGYGFYLVHAPGHPRRATIEAVLAWMRSVA